MGSNEKRKIEIEKFHRGPLPPLNQARTEDSSDFLGTALIYSIIVVDMGHLAPSVYEAARSRREDDDLDRWRFAVEIVEVILATPAEWSARTGSFGNWGSGKSTLLRFAEQMFQETRTLFFGLIPGLSKIGTMFGKTLVIAFQKHCLKRESPLIVLG